MEMNELVERMESARRAALADRDEAHGRVQAGGSEPDALAARIEAQCSHAVALALGRILGEDTPIPA